MIKLTIAILWLTVTAADTNDLGIITARRPIILHGCQVRTDFDRFIVRIPARGEFQTNDLVLTNFTGILRVNDELRWVYQGPQILEVYSICQDGEHSPTNRFTFNLQRLAPRPPVAEAMIDATPPPVPPGFKNFLDLMDQQVKRLRALPGGTNVAYPNITNAVLWRKKSQ